MNIYLLQHKLSGRVLAVYAVDEDNMDPSDKVVAKLSARGYDLVKYHPIFPQNDQVWEECVRRELRVDTDDNDRVPIDEEGWPEV